MRTQANCKGAINPLIFWMLLSLVMTIGAVVSVFVFKGSSRESGFRTCLVVIGVEGLGVEDLSCYAPSAPVAGSVRTPQIDALAAEGVRFTRCEAHAFATATTMLGEVGEGTPRMLGEVFDHAGYRTRAFSNSPLTEHQAMLKPGFDVFDAPLVSRNAKATLEAASAWIGEQPPSTPFFLFINLDDLRSGDKATADPAALRQRHEERVQVIDSAIGDFMRTLEEKGFAKRTVLILSAPRTAGKADPDTEQKGINVPLIVRGSHRWRTEVQDGDKHLLPNFMAASAQEAQEATELRLQHKASGLVVDRPVKISDVAVTGAAMCGYNFGEGFTPQGADLRIFEALPVKK